MNFLSQSSAACLSSACLALGLLTSAANAADGVRLSGAAAMCAALTPAKADLEKAAGGAVTLLSKNAGKGLQDLCAGRCDIAMVSGSLEKAAAGANAETPGSVDLKGVKSVEVGQDPILFVVHPSNPVNSLTVAQLKAIYTGTIANWKDLGGADQPITLFTLGARNGPRIAVDEQVLKGEAVAKTAVLRETPKDICLIVAQKPDGIGFLGKSNEGPGVKTLKIDQAVAMPMLLVTQGDPNPVQARIIEATKKALAAK